MKDSHVHYPELMIRDGKYRFPLPLEYGEPFRTDLRRRVNTMYKKQAEPWTVSNNTEHVDHPLRMFAHTKKAQEEALEALRIAAIKREKKITKRLLKHSTDTHLSDILTSSTSMAQHLQHHRKHLDAEDIAGKTIWKWTWTKRTKPFAGHSRGEMLASASLPTLPFSPQAPN